jgi:hypothetical protein
MHQDASRRDPAGGIGLSRDRARCGPRPETSRRPSPFRETPAAGGRFALPIRSRCARLTGAASGFRLRPPGGAIAGFRCHDFRDDRQIGRRDLASATQPSRPNRGFDRSGGLRRLRSSTGRVALSRRLRRYEFREGRRGLPMPRIDRALEPLRRGFEPNHPTDRRTPDAGADGRRGNMTRATERSGNPADPIGTENTYGSRIQGIIPVERHNRVRSRLR